MYRPVTKMGGVSTAPAVPMAAPAGGTRSSVGVLAGGTPLDTGGWGLHGGSSVDTDWPTVTITPDDGGTG